MTLANWQNFYVIVGSSAGALTGLQFVVMTLVAQARTIRNMRDIHAFGTPTVIHFCSALVISAIMTAPWPALTTLGICVGLYGAAGIAYSLRAFWHARNAAYQPDLEDWIWYTAAPLLAYVALIAAAVLMWWNQTWSSILIAADALAFLFLGVHNAWDTVTYIAVQHIARERKDNPKD